MKNNKPETLQEAIVYFSDLEVAHDYLESTCKQGEIKTGEASN